MKKAYGFPLGPVTEHDGMQVITGMCVDEDGKLLGYWTSSDIRFLESDLQNHARGYDYHFSLAVPYEVERKIDQSIKGRR